MAPIPLVREQIEDGLKLVARLAQEGFPVTAAAWVMESDGLQWYLYLVSPGVDRKGPTQAYKRLHAIFQKMRQESLLAEPPDIKFIAPTDPAAKGIVAFRDQQRGRLPAWFRGTRLGEVEIEAAYVYGPVEVRGSSDAASEVA